MMRKVIHIVMLLALTLLPVWGLAQTEAPTSLDSITNRLNIQNRMLEYVLELQNLNASCCNCLETGKKGDLTSKQLTVLTDSLKYIERALASFGVRWNTYYQTKQTDIASEESLLEIVARIQEMQQTVNDSILVGKQRLDSFEAFQRAETFIFSQDSIYKRLYSESMALTVSGKLAPQLEKVKAQEQVVFADVESNYADAKTAAESIPSLQPRMNKIEDKYVELKNVSTKIQEAAYTPFIQRVKDYLLGFAAVAILLMFINLMSAKFKTIKEKREQAKKLKNMLNKDKQYPTI